MQILTFTSLFPNPAMPQNGIFVEERLRQLVASGRVEAQVLAPVPWFPLAGRRFGRYGRFAAAPREALRHGGRVRYPRYPVIPKIGMNLAPWLMERALRGPFGEALAERPQTALVDAHYLYPDGVAAVRLGRRFGLPVVVTARGTDVNLIPRFRLPRRMILAAAREAAGVITVNRALKRALVALGVDGDRITVLRNGVDLERFRRVDGRALRARLQVDGKLLLSVGNLLEAKGHHLVIDALARLPDVRLVIAGEGPMQGALERRARALGVAARVRLVGAVAHDALRDYYSAADALVLASAREGMPNVVLESIACGTPVIATNVGGIPEVITSRTLGVLLERRDVDSLVAAITGLLEHDPDRRAIRQQAEAFSWNETTRGQLRLFEELIARRARVSAAIEPGANAANRRASPGSPASDECE
jgi:glycosyltransferase involved in cell wall biosynthesis